MPPVPSGLSIFDFLNSSAFGQIRTGCQVMGQKPSDTTKSLQGSLTNYMLPFSDEFMDPFVLKNKTQL